MITKSSSKKNKSHIPVLLNEVLALLAPHAGGLYVDGTFGTGGYSHAILESANCRVIGIDRDPKAIDSSAKTYQSEKLTLIKGKFGSLISILKTHSLCQVDGITLDLGTSTWQVNTQERGFSFKVNGPLDMRMDTNILTASNIINTCTVDELTKILQQLGEEQFASKVARAIACMRPIIDTRHLANIVHDVLPYSRKRDQATKTFQAIRLFINDELDELRRVLLASEQVLAPKGRLIVVTFHSLEDRIVKSFLHSRAVNMFFTQTSRYKPTVTHGYTPTFHILTPHALRPSSSEIITNPHARSARLRAAERTFISNIYKSNARQLENV